MSKREDEDSEVGEISGPCFVHFWEWINTCEEV